MQCKELKAVLELEGLSPLPPEAREHLAGCRNCQDLLADLSAIVFAAKHLPAEVAPPDRIWISVRAQLEAEGIIRNVEPVATLQPASWWLGFADLFRPRALATVGVGLVLVLGSIYLVQHRGSNKVAQQPQPVQAQPGQPPAPVAPPPFQASSKPPTPHAPAPTPSAHAPVAPQAPELRPSPSENAYLGDTAGVLSQTESAIPSQELANNPAVDAAMRQSLRTLDEFIAECEARLKQNPRDQLTREYLNMAYQQKAELLTSMMDSGRSEH